MEAQERKTDTRKLASATPRIVATPKPKATIKLKLRTSAPVRAAIATPRPTPTPVINYTIYVVQKGDTLYSIARRYKTDVKTLQRINHINDPATLYVGQKIKVPKLRAAPRPTTPAQKAGTITYIVQKGDTLSSIARKFHTSVSTLQQLNHFSDPNNLVVGSSILVPGEARPTTTVAPVATKSGANTEVHTLPVTPSPTSGIVAASAAQASPPPPTSTPTPTPIPTMPSVCEGELDAVFVWGVSFCVPPGWALQEYVEPYRTALLTKTEKSHDRSLYAISRMDGSPNAPLSWSMRQAKKSISTEIASLIPGGLAEPEEWSLATSVNIAGVQGQMSETTTTYLKTGHKAKVRVIVFNKDNKRWRIVMIAPQELWQSYDISVFPYIARHLEVF